MKLNQLLTPAAMALIITMATVPALAQSGRNQGQRRSGDRGTRATESNNQSRSRGDVAVRRSAPRGDSGRSNSAIARSQPSDNRGYTARQNDNRGYTPRQNDNRGYTPRQNDNRGYTPRQNDNRGYTSRQNDYRGNNNGGYANRGYSSRQNDYRRYNNGGYATRGYSSRQYSSRNYGWGGSYDRNVWRDRIRFGLGLSIFAGRPFGFHFDYGWRPGFDYRYEMRQGVAYGGMSFLLSPDYAEVYIDGNFVGVARDFGGQPVPVAVGYHRIELYAQGFEPVAFDINVFPGQVIPYRGSLSQVY